MDFNDVKIFIPSKGRPNKQKTYHILKELGLKPILVIEPQDEDDYSFFDYEYILLPENDKGISFSRNYIMEYSRKNHFDYIVQIDDDVNSFYRKNSDGKLLKDNASFIEALNRFIEYKGYCGLEYQQFSWCQENQYTHNRSVEVCLMMYLPNIPENVKFDPLSKEDKDFAIQLIFLGKKTMKMNDICFSVPKIGTNEGGLHNWYMNDGDRDASLYMLNKWGSNIIKLKNKNGRIDAMVNWRNICSSSNDFSLF